MLNWLDEVRMEISNVPFNACQRSKRQNSECQSQDISSNLSNVNRLCLIKSKRHSDKGKYSWHIRSQYEWKTNSLPAFKIWCVAFSLNCVLDWIAVCVIVMLSWNDTMEVKTRVKDKHGWRQNAHIWLPVNCLKKKLYESRQICYVWFCPLSGMD